MKNVQYAQQKIRRVQAQKRRFILMMAMLLIVFGYPIWQVNRNIERELEVVTMYKLIFTEVLPESLPSK